MLQYDITEKILVDYNDVFADIANVVFFNGEKRIKSNALQEIKLRSHYKSQDDLLHEQERDAGKFWRDGGLKIAFYGFENQTKEEKTMPIRIIGYDGASYREQLLDENLKDNYPVISLVLYFGMTHWKTPKNLKGILKIPEGLEPFVNDYQIHVCEVAWLTDEQVASFQSDFRIVADFFVQKRKNKDYIPSAQKMKHVDAVLKLISVFAKDNRYYDVIRTKKKKGEKPKNMCEVYDKIEQRGIQTGRLEGIKALVETCQEFEMTEEEILVRIQNKFPISKEEAQTYLQEYWIE